MPDPAVGIVDLLIPILASTVTIFFASFLFWALLAWHNSDWEHVPDEENARKVLKALNLPPGQYFVPNCSTNKERQSEEFINKIKEGPNMMFTVKPDELPNMGKMMGGWILYVFFVCLAAAYISTRTLPAGADYLTVFQIAGGVGAFSFCMALIPQSIWWGRSWKATIKEVVDGLVYALILGGFFGWLWPAAV